MSDDKSLSPVEGKPQSESGDASVLRGGMSVERLRTIVQACHLNFLIGAGTSSEFFAPLGEVENVLTDIASSGAGAAEQRLARASVQAYFFANVIEPNRELLGAASGSVALLRSYGKFGRAINHLLLTRRSSLLSKKANIFTTNVDLAIEVAFERLGLELNDGFVGKLRPTFDAGIYGAIRYRTGARYEHRAEVPTFDLHKLHGSVGWRLVDDVGVPSGIDFDTRLSDLEAIRAALDEVSSSLLEVDSSTTAASLLDRAAGADPDLTRLSAFEEAYERLVIVNPEKQKFATTVLTETYYEMIRRFANELERENTVLFVHGFSFRDEHLRKIVVRAARSNPTLQVVIYCYLDAARAEIRGLIPDGDVPNRNFAYVVPSEETGPLTLSVIVDRFIEPLSATEPREPDDKIEQLFAVPTVATEAVE